MKAHEMNRTIVEHIDYPPHEPRTATPEYEHNRHVLLERITQGCWICGTHENLETHHWFEWALWNDLNPETVRVTLRMLDFYGYAHAAGDAPIKTPDDIRNLVILCAHHHRMKDKGIHDLTFPIWLAQKAARNPITE